MSEHFLAVVLVGGRTSDKSTREGILDPLGRDQVARPGSEE